MDVSGGAFHGLLSAEEKAGLGGAWLFRGVEDFLRLGEGPAGPSSELSLPSSGGSTLSTFPLGLRRLGALDFSGSSVAVVAVAAAGTAAAFCLRGLRLRDCLSGLTRVFLEGG